MKKAIAMISLCMYALIFALYLDALQTGRMKWRELPVVDKKINIKLKIIIFANESHQLASTLQHSLSQIHLSNTIVHPSVQITHDHNFGKYLFSGDSLRVALVPPSFDEERRLTGNSYYKGNGGVDYFTLDDSNELSISKFVSSLKKRIKHSVEGSRSFCSGLFPSYDLRFVLWLSDSAPHYDLGNLISEMDRLIPELVTGNTLLSELVSLSHSTEVKYNISLEGTLPDILDAALTATSHPLSSRKTLTFVLAIDPPSSLHDTNLISPDFGGIYFSRFEEVNMTSVVELFAHNFLRLSGLDPFDVVSLQRLRLAECLMGRIRDNYRAIGTSSLLVDGAVRVEHMQQLVASAGDLEGIEFLEGTQLGALAGVFNFSEFVLNDYNSFEFTIKQFEVRYLMMTCLFTAPVSLLFNLIKWF